MAINVKFLQGLQAAYNAIASKETNTFYYTTDEKNFYLGTTKINNAQDLINALTANQVAYKGTTVKAVLDTLLGVVGTEGSIAYLINEAITGLKGSATIASKSGNVVTIKTGIVETNGKISNNTETDIALAEVATTGAAADVSVADTAGNFEGATVEAVLAEIAGDLGNGVDSKTVYVTEAAGQASDAYSKRYSIYQGAKGSTASPVITEKLVDIDLPKDMVVSDGVCRKATAQDVTDAGENPGFVVGDYIIILTIANNNGTKIYIPVNGLVDIYTPAQEATQIQLAIDANNVISASIVNGSVDTNALGALAVTTAKIADEAVTTAKIADGAVTASKISIAEKTESQSAGTDGLALEVKTENGQVKSVSGSIAANTYDAAGAAATAKSEVIGESTDAAGALTIYGAKKYAEERAAAGVTNVVEGTTAGTVAITKNGATADVPVHGLATVATTGAAIDVSYESSTVKAELDKIEGDASTIGSIAKAQADAVNTVVGASGDTSSADTVNGAKKYAEEKVEEALTWGTFPAGV